MEIIFNEQRVKEMLQQEIVFAGEKINGLTIPVSCFTNCNQLAFLYDSNNFNLLGANEKGLDFYGVTSEELEGRNAFYLEKKKNEQHPNTTVEFASKAEKDLSSILSLGKPQMFTPFENITNTEGYCVVDSNMRTPVYKNEKIAGILSINWDVTRSENIEKLYGHYKRVYADDMKTGNKLFTRYIGLPTNNFLLTTRELETLIALAKNHTHIDAARELDIEGGTLSTYVQSIKHRLQNQNLNDILLHFTTNDRRKF